MKELDNDTKNDNDTKSDNDTDYETNSEHDNDSHIIVNIPDVRHIVVDANTPKNNTNVNNGSNDTNSNNVKGNNVDNVDNGNNDTNGNNVKGNNVDNDTNGNTVKGNNVDNDTNGNTVKGNTVNGNTVKGNNDTNGNNDINGNNGNNGNNTDILTNIEKLLLNNNSPLNIDTFIKNDTNKLLEKLTFRNVNDIIKTQYMYKENNSSTALDILAVFMKGQKILYTESKTLCEQKLNFLMLPAIFISSVCTVLSLVISSWEWGKIVVSGLNAFNAFLLAVISYMKLDAKAEAHKTSSYKYDKLQAECEFYSGKLLFFSSEDVDIHKKIQEMEAKVKEIKETNQFILPEIIRNRYPVIYSTNVFSEVKKIQYDEMIIINKLKDSINEAINIKNLGLSDNSKPRLMELEKSINDNLKDVIEHRKKFLDIDDDFEEEINNARINRNNRCCRFDFLKS